MTYDIGKAEHQAKVNLQSLQDVGILDIVLENQDRNPGNILVVPRQVSLSAGTVREVLDLVPVDHALTLQHKEFGKSIAFSHHQDLCWTSWTKADVPLTKATLEKIISLDTQVLLKALQDHGIVIDEKIKSPLTQNVAFLQKVMSEKPDISLADLYKLFKASALSA